MRSKNVKTLALAVMACAMLTVSAGAENGYVEDPVSYDGSAAVFNYAPYDQYVVYTKVGYVTDIVLRPDEAVQKVAAGNTLQWAVEKDDVAGHAHVYIKPLAESTTNVIINTSRRSYRLLVTAENPNYVQFAIRWNYPVEDEQERQAAMAARTAAMNEANAEIAEARERASRIHRNYKCVKNKNVTEKLIPKSVFDDGSKTYIEITPDNTQNMPVIYYYDDFDKSKLQLANYRLKGNFLEIDRVMNNMKLQFSQKQFLLIERIDENEKVPSAGDIQFNSASSEELSEESLRAGKHQLDVVELRDTKLPTLKERLAEKERARQLEVLRAANGQPEQQDNDTDDALNRLADVLESEGGNEQ